MQILLTGGTGFIGSYLIQALQKRGDKVIVVTRNPERRPPKGVHFVGWDDELAEVVSNCDAVINLAGSNLFDERWTDSVRETILASRINATATIIQAIRDAKNKPKVLISGSAIGYYGTRGSDKLDESQPPGSDFLAKVCLAWETEANKLDVESVRLVNARIGIVQQKDDGALSKMLLPFKLYGGGPLGEGSQYYPWIHMHDMVHALLFIIENETLSGPVNIVSPNPVTMDEFAKVLGKVMSRPSWFRVPEFMLKIAVGDSANSITSSYRVIPKKLKDAGYKFRFAEVESALRDILRT